MPPKCIGLSTPNLSDLNTKAITHGAHTKAHDPRHPLYLFFTLLPCGHRYRSLGWTQTRHGRSFVPSAIALIYDYRYLCINVDVSCMDVFQVNMLFVYQSGMLFACVTQKIKNKNKFNEKYSKLLKPLKLPVT